MCDLSLREQFLNTFPLLTKVQKRVWEYLRWYSQKFRHVFPSHKTIAEAVQCCRDSVIESVKKFVELGWIGTKKRCFRSSLYFMATELIEIDSRDPKTFQRQFPQPNPPKSDKHSDSISDTSICIHQLELMNDSKGSENVQHLDAKKEAEIPHILRELPMPISDKHKLSRFSERVLARAIEQAQTYVQKGYRIRVLAAYLTDACKREVAKLKKRLMIDTFTPYPELLIN